MELFRYILLAADEDVDSSFNGMFSGARGVMGIVMMVTGVLIIYIAVKVFKGYRFLPAAGDGTIVEEDKYVEAEAKVIEKTVTAMPDLSGGEDREFIEWKIVYTVDGEEYAQHIPDDGYEQGDTLKIKYDPHKPDGFYLMDEEESNADDSDSFDPNEQKSRTTGLVLTVLGVLVIMGGAALRFM